MYTVFDWNEVLIVLFNCLESIFGNNAGIKSRPSLSQNIHIIYNNYSCFFNTVVYERGLGCLFFFHLHFSITFTMTYCILSQFTLPSLLALLLNFHLLLWTGIHWGAVLFRPLICWVGLIGPLTQTLVSSLTVSVTPYLYLPFTESIWLHNVCSS